MKGHAQAVNWGEAIPKTKALMTKKLLVKTLTSQNNSKAEAVKTEAAKSILTKDILIPLDQKVVNAVQTENIIRTKMTTMQIKAAGEKVPEEEEDEAGDVLLEEDQAVIDDIQFL
jgi:hypothetical protein